jgi:hypothetical protein
MRHCPRLEANVTFGVTRPVRLHSTQRVTLPAYGSQLTRNWEAASLNSEARAMRLLQIDR